MEVLVVITIVVVLVAITLPAVNSVREGARRSACGANQVRLVMAMSRFHASKSFLPGVSDQIQRVDAPGTFRGSNWIQVLLPYLEHNDLYSKLQQNISPDVPLSELLCPSGLTTDRGTAWIAYGVNDGTTAYPWDGVLLPSVIRRSLDEVRERDGLTNTFLTADKLGRTIGRHNDWESWRSSGATGRLGFRDWKVPSPWMNNFSLNQSSTPPRSWHPEGVMATFCDGRVKLLKSDLAPHVFAHLATPYSFWTGTSYSKGAGAVNSNSANSWLRSAGSPPKSQEPVRLKESDY